MQIARMIEAWRVLMDALGIEPTQRLGCASR
jgi:hypothetical protein